MVNARFGLLAAFGCPGPDAERVGDVVAERRGSAIVEGAVICFGVCIHADGGALAGEAEVGGVLWVGGLAVVDVGEEVEGNGWEKGQYEDGQGLGHRL